jgi:LPXTG-site transpeptidase (sortase) family protein
MRGLVPWLRHLFEWTLLGFGLGCLAMYAYERVEAQRFQTEQAAAFDRDAQARLAPGVVRPGALVGMLDVPRLRLSTPVVEGDDSRTLKRSVGHLPDTPMPWGTGNSAIAGHRDGLFRPLKDVEIGDEIRFRTTRQEYRYVVTKTAIVMPDDLSVLAPQPEPATLTLITCYPFYYVGAAPQRFVVHAARK